jgi:hypothetical protein
MQTIQELLYARGLNPDAKIKMVRHKRQKVNLDEKYRLEYEKFLQFQCEQKEEVFKDVSYIVSFVGEDSTLSRFIGVFEVLGIVNLPVAKQTMYGEGEYNYLYEMKKLNGFEDLEDKVVVDWHNPISWHQWLQTSNSGGIVEVRK